MIPFRNFLVFLMFAAFLVGCTTPLIDIDVKHSAGGGTGSGGSSCPAWAIPYGCISSGGASLPVLGEVTKIETFSNAAATATIQVYTIHSTDDNLDRELRVPPWVAVGPPGLNKDVKVTYSNATIEEITP